MKVYRRSLVAVIGFANLPADSPLLIDAECVGRMLVEADCRVLTGGLGGVMQAASRGAHMAVNYQAGDTVGILPGYSPTDANPHVDIAIATGLDQVRNAIIAHADAVIAIGGGAGTLSEIALAWISHRLIIALRRPGWSGRLADQRIDNRIRYKHIQDDRVYGADTSEEAVRLLVKMLALYDLGHNDTTSEQANLE